ncbi:hypothetical protein [Rhodanobacter lindaniclasticus]|uniref:Uncharacterized protein n=1 Tax=Rhodanobacter lindaniclasticus TaxID=75310 RepID=A0A4S3KC67_9GAMM|nr:hypothetical protein [Rhodanobacter lindaniclasticus]THD06005.1 hypothetical protein B1991_15025 [Rhodanobacter lindaniclasticus]
MRDLELLLPTLEPPPGGLSRLQRAVAAKHRPRHVRGRVFVGAALAIPALVLALLWVPRYVAGQQRAAALRVALQQAVLGPALGEGLRVEHGAAIELASGQANVRLYLIETVPAEPGAGS